MSDEPIFWADLLRQGRTRRRRRARRTVAGRRDIPPELPQGVPRQGHAHRRGGVRSRRRPRSDSERCASSHDASANAIVHCGFGFGVVLRQPRARRSLSGIHPRFTGTALQNAWIERRHVERDHGLDRRRPVRRGQPGRPASSWTTTRPRYGRSPECCVPVVNRDLATVMLPRVRRRPPARARAGVKDALERSRCCQPRRVRRAPDVVRQVEAPARLDRSRLPRGPASSTPTASTRPPRRPVR